MLHLVTQSPIVHVLDSWSSIWSRETKGHPGFGQLVTQLQASELGVTLLLGSTGSPAPGVVPQRPVDLPFLLTSVEVFIKQKYREWPGVSWSLCSPVPSCQGSGPSRCTGWTQYPGAAVSSPGSYVVISQTLPQLAAAIPECFPSNKVCHCHGRDSLCN